VAQHEIYCILAEKIVKENGVRELSALIGLSNQSAPLVPFPLLLREPPPTLRSGGAARLAGTFGRVLRGSTLLDWLPSSLSEEVV